MRDEPHDTRHDTQPIRITRRGALRFVAAISAAAAQPEPVFAADAPAARGYGTDPSMTNPAATWPLTLGAPQRSALAALCDLVLPADGGHPSASACGVHEFLDEWVSAPYPRMRQDRALVTLGLQELDRRALDAHQAAFAQATPAQQARLFAAFAADTGRDFAVRLVNLICGGYYTTPAGHADMGYVGNQALAVFPAPAPEVVRQLEAAVGALAAGWAAARTTNQ